MRCRFLYKPKNYSHCLFPHRAACGPKEIVPFETNKTKYGKNKAKKFVIGMKEIQETPNITCGPQLVTSVTVPITPDKPSDPGNGDGAEVASKPSSEIKTSKKASANKSKEKRSTTSHHSNKSKKRKIDEGGDVKDESETKLLTETESIAEQPDRETIAPRETGDEKMKEDIDEKLEEPKNKKSELTEEEKRTKKEQKAREKDRLKQELKEKKLEKKRKERIEQLKSQEVTTTTLTDLDVEIMQSLNVESLDTARCLNAMSKLDLIQVNQDILVKYPNILYTIKKCRKFKGDQTVRQKADYLFNKFKTLFTVGVTETARKLLDLTNEASQDSASSSSPTREDTTKTNSSIPAATVLPDSSDVPKVEVPEAAKEREPPVPEEGKSSVEEKKDEPKLSEEK